MPEFRSPFRILALATALAAAFALAGCGRKGPLDPPPAANLTGEKAAPIGSGGTAGNPGVGPDGQPLAPKGQNKHLPIDVLLN